MNPVKKVVNGAYKSVMRNSHGMRGGADIGRTAIIALIFLSFLAITFVVLYVLYLMKTYNYSKTEIITRTMSLRNETAIGSSGKAVRLPKLRNGEQQAYTFWLYLPHYVPGATAEHKLLWQSTIVGTPLTAGSSSPSPSSSSTTNVIAAPIYNHTSNLDGSPIVFMDSRTNRMYISFRTTAASGSVRMSDLIPSGGTEVLLGGYVTAIIEYLPLQRWLNFVIAIQDNVATIYLDGEVYSVKSISDVRYQMGANPPVRPSFNLYPGVSNGGDVVGGVATELAGYFSNFHFYNYLLSQKQIQSIYRSGPHAGAGGGWFAWLSFGTWKLRSPFERLPGTDVDTGNQFDN